MSEVGGIPRRRRRIAALGVAFAPLLISASLVAPAFAQTVVAPGDEAPPAAPQTYDASFFAVYNPLTAADMLARIPGFEINDGDDRRGFGATGGNVLINGERPSSKATITDQLKRIPAASVMRVEMLSGGGSADVAGQSRAANVILKHDAGPSPLTWIAGARHLQYSNRLGYTLQLSKSFSLGNDAEVCDIFRDGLQQLDRQAGANEMRFLPTLRTQVETVVTTYQPQIATDPLVRRDLAPATDFLTGAAQRAADTRRRNENHREELTQEITGQVEAAARAEGRSEARSEFRDALSGMVNKK